MEPKNIAMAVGGVIAVGAIGFVGAVAMQPDAIDVQRSIEVVAQPDDLWPLVSDFSKRGQWDPWDPRDPDQKVTWSDPPTGVGATYGWEGPINGQGGMTVKSVDPGKQIVHEMAFIEPFESQAEVTMDLASSDAGTTVTWTMHSPNSFGGKMAMLFMDMEGMLGKDFEQGLANLKTVGEKAALERGSRERAEAEAKAKAEAEAAAQEGAGADGEQAVGGAVGVSHEGG